MGWGQPWGSPWGDVMRWGERDDDGALLPIPPGELDATATALARLWKQFEADTQWRRLMTVIGEVFGEVETTAGVLRQQLYRETATGVQLDKLGALVGRARGGQTDDADYRRSILCEAVSIVSDGAPEDLIDLATALAPTGLDVLYDEYGPASFSITIPDLPLEDWTLILEIAADVPPAGVGAWLVTYNADTSAGWGWDPQPDTAGAMGWDPQPAGVRSTWSWAQRLGT